jgi:hypothetical protein
MKIETIEDIAKVIVNLPSDLREYLISNVTPSTFVSCLLLLGAGGNIKDFASALKEHMVI